MSPIKSRIFVFIAFYACTPPLEMSSPENTLRQFFHALSQGKRAQAWEMLSSDTQMFLAHKVALASENTSGLLPASPATIVFVPELAPPLLETMELVEADEKTARLRVVTSQKSTLLTMKKEVGLWKLALNLGVPNE
ncbi:MAG: hypothetical protein FWC18_06580 [Cystobacterineae bacterium]|nr:hypothetical protein [Cystobacterineae bacterium]